MGPGGQAHVAFIAFPFGTHAAPLFSLARAVTAASPSHAISFLSTARSLASLPPSSSSSSSVSAGEIHMVTVSEGMTPSTPPPGSFDDVIGVFLDAAPRTLRDGLDAAAEAAGGLAVTCLVTDAFLWMAADVAHAMNVPFVAVWTGGLSAFSGHIYTDSLRDSLGFNEEIKADEPILSVPGLSGHLVCDLPEGIVAGRFKDASMSVHLHRMGQKLPKAVAAVVFNTMQGLEPDIDADMAPKFPRYLPVGPFHLLPSARSLPTPDPSGCIPWLNGRTPASVAYISFGSIMAPQPTELAELAAGLEASGLPFLWSLREISWSTLPPGFLERTKKTGLVVNWAPQLDVLGHEAVGVFMTHCGWNSVVEGITAGVPMVCRPSFGDQRMNARSVSELWKVGVVLEGGKKVTKEGVAAALDVVMKQEEGKRMKERAGELKSLAVNAVAPTGSSTKNLGNLLDLVRRF